MGQRVGTKRADRRWEVGGVVWASEYEYNVYRGLCDVLGEQCVLKCEAGESHSFGYTSNVQQARCTSCGSRDVVQERVYTPDICVVAQGANVANGGRIYIETKGYPSPTERRLLHSICKSNQELDLVFVYQSNRKWKGMKQTPLEWTARMLKKPGFVWDGKKAIPDALVSYLTGVPW